MRTSLLRGLACIALATSLTGCAGYQLGTMLPPDIKTVHIPTFVNRTSEPRIEFDTTQAAIQEFQRDGSLKVAGPDQADALLKVELGEYKIEPVAYTKEQRTKAREYRITMTAAILMTRRSDDSVVVESPRVRGEAVFPVAGDLSSSKLVGLPSAAEDLAHNIVEKVVEVW